MADEDARKGNQGDHRVQGTLTSILHDYGGTEQVPVDSRSGTMPSRRVGPLSTRLTSGRRDWTHVSQQAPSQADAQPPPPAALSPERRRPWWVTPVILGVLIAAIAAVALLADTSGSSASRDSALAPARPHGRAYSAFVRRAEAVCRHTASRITVVPASASPKATLAHVVAAEPTIARYVRDLERVRPPRAAAHEYATFVAEQRAFLVRLRRAVADLKAHRLNAGRLLLIEEVGAARISGAQALALRLPACAKTSQALG